jgi:hypothetical protein
MSNRPRIASFFGALPRDSRGARWNDSRLRCKPTNSTDADACDARSGRAASRVHGHGRIEYWRVWTDVARSGPGTVGTGPNPL